MTAGAPRNQAMNNDSNHLTAVALFVPMYKPPLSSDEAISLRHLKHYLNRCDKFLVIPEDLDFSDPDFDLIRFPAAYFKSVATFNPGLFAIRPHVDCAACVTGHASA